MTLIMSGTLVPTTTSSNPPSSSSNSTCYTAPTEATAMKNDEVGGKKYSEKWKNCQDPRKYQLPSCTCRVKRKWYHAIFLIGGFCLLVCLLQILLPPPFGMRQSSAEVAEQPFSDGCADGMESCVCPRETVCADTTISMVLLALARCSAFFDYPLYMMMFLSKAHNINDVLRRTPIREVVDFADMHHVHRVFGIVVGIETLFHSFFHLLRWGLRGDDITLLWQSSTGISGLIACLMTPLIVWPMVLPWLREKMSFEWRKGLHFLSWLWAIVLLYHAPSRIYLLIGIPALIYLVDRVFGFFFRTHLCDTVQFERYGEGGVVVEFKNPKGFDTGDGSGKTAYVYVMIPWLSRFQWHAFTLFPHPTMSNHSTLCIGNAGDWTKQLHTEIDAPSIRTAYFYGPFESEFSDVAIDATHCIAVASGIGITPTLSLVQRYNEIKRVNVIWACRDAGLVEYFLHKMDLSAISQYAFLLIFYTGTRDLVIPKRLPANFFIFRTRPKLESTIAGIISVIEKGEDLPEEMYENQRHLADISFDKRIKVALARVLSSYSRDEFFEYGVEKTEELKLMAARPMMEHAHATTSVGPFSTQQRRTGVAVTRKRRTVVSERYASVRRTVQKTTDVLLDMPPGEISLEGLDATISSLLGGIGDYTIEDMKSLFEQVDTDGSGYIDKAELDSFFDIALTKGSQDTELIDRIERGLTRGASVSSMGRRISNERQGMDKSSHSLRSSTATEARQYVDELFGGYFAVEHVRELSNDPDAPLRDWSLFYCGGSARIEKELKDTKKKYGIGDLAVERFNW